MLAQSLKRATSRLRSTLPMPRRGSSSTMCTSLGAAVEVQRRLTWVRNSASVGAREAVGRHHGRGHPFAQPLVGYTEDGESATLGCAANTASTSCGKRSARRS